MKESLDMDRSGASPPPGPVSGNLESSDGCHHLQAATLLRRLRRLHLGPWSSLVDSDAGDSSAARVGAELGREEANEEAAAGRARSEALPG